MNNWTWCQRWRCWWWSRLEDMKTHLPSPPRSREFKWMGRDAQDPFIASPPPHNVDNVERCTATMQPLSTHIVVCRFAGHRQANGQWQPYRSTQISSSPAYQALLGLLQTWIERGGKLTPIKWEIGRRIWFLESHSPLLVVAMVPRRRCSPGVISQLSGQAWPNLPWWLAARAALTHPTTLPTFITIALPIFISWYILFSSSIIRKSLSSIWSIACVDYQ